LVIHRPESLNLYDSGCSRHNQKTVPPFYFPVENPSERDIVFYIRIQENILLVYAVQLKSCQVLTIAGSNSAVDTVSEVKIRKHMKELEHCPYGMFINIVIAYPNNLTDTVSVIKKLGEEDKGALKSRRSILRGNIVQEDQDDQLNEDKDENQLKKDLKEC
ncbi:hypothetical protein BGZ49_007743, partial [Haplosporangium sp. Z 27]